MSGVLVDLNNGLIEADATTRLSALGRACHRRGLWFPLARPLPGLPLGEALSRLPVFADAFVAQVEGQVEGQPGRPAESSALSTPRAPRAAMGPDLIGGLMLDTPLFAAARVRVRVFDATRTSSFVEEHPDAACGAARIAALLDEGRAFSLEARKEQGRVLLHVLSGIGVAPPGPPALRPFAHAPDARVGGGRCLVPGDAAALARTLEAGARVLAAPFIGRVGALLPGRATLSRLPLDAACARLATNLTRPETPDVV